MLIFPEQDITLIEFQNRGAVTMNARNKLSIINETDENGNPAGGEVQGPGLAIVWQNGPLGRPARKATGAFVEDIIEAARQRIEFYQKAAGGKYACRENALAITRLEEAIMWLNKRRQEREERGPQGLHRP
jgi:hypothetical protein